MVQHYQGLIDHRGRPIEKKVLTEEIAGATVTGVRSPVAGYPGDGLNPVRLAGILKEADRGEPLRYLELAETIEERDLHYVGVLGTRKRAVSQLDITVEAASDDQADQDTAEMVREWLQRDELQDELFDILDATGKGVSYTEIIWDTSEGQWEPCRLEYRDPRHFKPNRDNLTTPMLIDEHGMMTDLPPFKFITATMRAKSGLPLRSGIARVAMWAWMFKAFANRDWSIFIQTYGQPIRLGKYGPGASQAEKDTLFRAVANIAGDCAAIIPESMNITFEETGAVGDNAGMYKERADWLDQQVSKGVLGQTATTDAIAGGHAVGREHREVQEDIERADAKQLSAILNRDLIRPWIALEKGPGHPVPRLKVGRPDQKDVKQIVEGVARMVPFGMRVGRSYMNDLLGVPEPDDTEDLLVPRQPTPRFLSPGMDAPQRMLPAPAQDETRHAQVTVPGIDALAIDGATLSAAAEAALLDAVMDIVAAHATPAGREAAVRAKWPGLPMTELKALMARALVLSELAGRDDAGG